MPDSVWPGCTVTDWGATRTGGSALITGAGPSRRGPQAASSKANAAAVAAASVKPFPQTFRIFPSARPPTRKKPDIWHAKPESCQALAAASPRQPGDERYKSHQTEVFGRKPMIMAANTHELLIP